MQQREQTPQASVSVVRPDARAQQSDLRQSRWSSPSSHWVAWVASLALAVTFLEEISPTRDRDLHVRDGQV